MYTKNEKETIFLNEILEVYGFLKNLSKEFSENLTEVENRTKNTLAINIATSRTRALEEEKKRIEIFKNKIDPIVESHKKELFSFSNKILSLFSINLNIKKLLGFYKLDNKEIISFIDFIRSDSYIFNINFLKEYILAKSKEEKCGRITFSFFVLLSFNLMISGEGAMFQWVSESFYNPKGIENYIITAKKDYFNNANVNFLAIIIKYTNGKIDKKKRAWKNSIFKEFLSKLSDLSKETDFSRDTREAIKIVRKESSAINTASKMGNVSSYNSAPNKGNYSLQFFLDRCESDIGIIDDILINFKYINNLRSVFIADKERSKILFYNSFNRVMEKSTSLTKFERMLELIKYYLDEDTCVSMLSLHNQSLYVQSEIDER